MKRVLLGLVLLAAPAYSEPAQYVSSYSPGYVARVAARLSSPIPLKLQFAPGSPFSGGSGGGGSSPPFSDSTSIVCDNGDPTKCFRLEASAITTGTVRVGSLPNANFTFAGIDLAQTWSAAQTINIAAGIIYAEDVQAAFGTSTSYRLIRKSTDTQRALRIETDTAVGNAVIVNELADTATNWAHAQQGHPAVFIHSGNTTVTEYQALRAVGTQCEIFKALTESAATSVIRIPVAAGAGTGGKLTYTVFATDGTDHQSRSSFIRFAAVNKAATETCGMSNNAGTADASITETEDGNASAISSGTLTYAITCDTTPANAVDIQINAVSSLTQTALRAYYCVTLAGPGEPLPQ